MTIVMVCSPSLPPDQTIKIGNMKKKLKIALGISLMPIFALVYFMDRALLVILPHLEQKKINHWFESNEAMTGSFLRIISLATLTGIYKLITFIF